MLLKLYNLEHTLIGGLRNCKDAKVDSVLSNGDKTLSFSWHQRNKIKIPHEYYIRTETDEFVVKENSNGSNGYRNIVANLNLEDLEGRAWIEYVVEGKTAQEAADYALTDTGWSCVSTVPETRLRNISMKKTTSYNLIQKILDAFTCEVRFDTVTKTVYLTEQIGDDKGAYFMSGINLKEITEKADSYDYATRIIPIGADGITIADVNHGIGYLENYQYSNKVKTIIWEDTNYTDAYSLKEDAEYKLNEISKPKRTLSAKVVDLAKIKPEYSILSYSVGDVVTLIDNESGINEKQRITKTVEYLGEPEKNTCEISNTVLSFEELQKKLFAAAECIDNITTDNGTVNGSRVDAIDVSQIIGLERYIAEDINDLRVDNLYVRKEFGTPNAVIGELTGTTATITNLKVTARADSALSYITELHAIMLYGNYAKFTTIESDNITALEERVNNFFANNITTEYLEANYADINLANVDIASIRQGFLTDLMVSQGLIADRIVGTEVTATDVLTGVNIYADDITAGTLSVDRLVFRGDEKSIVYQLNSISGALQAASVDTLNGEIITPRSITADRIVAQSITANEINVTDLVATGLIGTNQLTAANIATDAITSTKIAAGAITSAKIAAGAVTATKISVADLYALGATIGGFDIGTTAIYNGTNSKISTTAGIYLGTDAIRMCSDDSIYTHIENGRITTKDILLIDGLYGTYFTGIQTIDGPLKAESRIMTFSPGANNNNIKITSFSETEGVFLEGNTFLGSYFPETDFWTQCVFSGLYFEVGGYAKFKDQVYFSTYVQINGGALIANAAVGGFLDVGGNTYLSHTSVGGYNNASYALSTNSFICNSWVRTVGNSGWYNETYGGGWYMVDSTYIRNYNSKHLLLSGHCYFGSTSYYISNAGAAVVASLKSGNLSVSSSTIVSSGAAFNLANSSCTICLYNNTFRPTSDYAGAVLLGASNVRWGQIYTNASVNVSSDRRVKNSISSMDERYKMFFTNLVPRIYRLNHEGVAGGFNAGFVAQEVEEALLNAGLGVSDFAGLCIEDGFYALKYDQFIPIITLMEQTTIARVESQEQRIEALQNQVYNLQFKLEQALLEIEQLKAVA